MFRKETRARATVRDVYAYTVQYSTLSSIVLGSHWCCECPLAQPRHTLAAVAIGALRKWCRVTTTTMGANIITPWHVTSRTWSSNCNWRRPFGALIMTLCVQFFSKSNLVRVRVKSSKDDLLSVESACCLLLLYVFCHFVCCNQT